MPGLFTLKIRSAVTAPAVTLSLCAATPADADSIAALYAHYVLCSSSSFELHAPSPAIITERLQGIVSAGLPYLVAKTSAHGIVGYAYASPWKIRAAYHYSVEDSVYIAPDQQRKGAGKALLAALIQRCQTIGKKQMVAVITDADSAASVALHHRLGFRAVGVLRNIGYKFDRWHDTLLMQRAL